MSTKTASKERQSRIWDERVQGRIRSLRYDFDRRKGKIHVLGVVGDLDGLVTIFERIDPKVDCIVVKTPGIDDLVLTTNHDGKGWNGIELARGSV